MKNFKVMKRLIKDEERKLIVMVKGSVPRDTNKQLSGIKKF